MQFVPKVLELYRVRKTQANHLWGFESHSNLSTYPSIRMYVVLPNSLGIKMTPFR